MKKDLNYYLKLEYPIEINPIPKNKGGGYEAIIPQLGRYAFIGDGETIEEAIKDLEKTKKEYFRDYLQKGTKIPEPKVEGEDYSGKFLVRVPTFLHKYLSEEAKKNGISLNQYVNVLLSMNSPIQEFKSLTHQFFQYFGDFIIHYAFIKHKEIDLYGEEYRAEITKRLKFEEIKAA